MWRTASVVLGAALLAYQAGAWLTLDYQVWTAEGARRLQVARAPVAAPAVTLRGPGLDTPPPQLPQLLQADGAVTIVDFFYSRCATVCLALGNTFQQLQARLIEDGPGAAPVRLLSISFDPGHDTPTVLAAYAARLRADPRLWRFVAPADTAGLRTLLERFEVVVIPDGLGGYEHNAALLVVDRQGRLVGIFDDAEAEAVLAYAQHLAEGPK